MSFAFVLGQGLGIAATASISALVATGLAISFRLMGVINLAHGEFIMIGAYAAVVTLQLGAPFPAAVAVALSIGLLLGALTEVTLIRRFYRAPELAILGTFALGLVLRQGVALIFGDTYQTFNSPLPGAIDIAGVDFPAYRLVLALVAIVVLGAVIWAVAGSRLGVRIRAVSTDSSLAETLGIRSSRLKLLVFAASAGMASLAGALVAPTTNVDPYMGSGYLFTAFVVVIVSGSRLSMVPIAAIGTAVVQNLTAFALTPLAAQIAVLVLAFIVLALSRSAHKGVTV
jgi:branched-subunit amino acid ABC-type transport system permease component